jgi:Uma2 family endonuclease
MVAPRQPAPTRPTLDEFLAWHAGGLTGCTWQLIDGEPVAMAPGSETHGAIQSEAAWLLGNYLLERQSSCRVVTEPGIVPRVRAKQNCRIADLGVTCAPRSQNLMVHEPVLLIEILSPSNEVDTGANIWAYATVPSVREILAIRSTRIEAEPADPRRGRELAGRAGTHRFRRHCVTAEHRIRGALAAFYRTTALAVQD